MWCGAVAGVTLFEYVVVNVKRIADVGGYKSTKTQKLAKTLLRELQCDIERSEAKWTKKVRKLLLVIRLQNHAHYKIVSIHIPKTIWFIRYYLYIVCAVHVRVQYLITQIVHSAQYLDGQKSIKLLFYMSVLCWSEARGVQWLYKCAKTFSRAIKTPLEC